MRDWKWVSIEAALAAHSEQLAAHGGADGVRDAGLFESAMTRAQNHVAYGNPDAATLAAAYAYGLARNHPFIDGNKRAALVVSEGFLAKNGLRLEAPDAELLAIFLDLAAGEISEDELADWFRTASSRPDSQRTRGPPKGSGGGGRRSRRGSCA